MRSPDELSDALNDDAEQLETRLRAIPAHSGLVGEQEEQFRRLRQRIGQRQGDWRRSMGSLGSLFDDDAHCAKALAGNLATELTEILKVWARIRSEGGPPRRRELQPLLTWIGDVAAQWRAEARGYVALEGWTGEAVDVFDGFLDELSARAVANAVERFHRVEPTRRAGAGRWGVIGAWITILMGAVRRVFHPRPPESR